VRLHDYYEYMENRGRLVFSRIGNRTVARPDAVWAVMSLKVFDTKLHNDNCELLSLLLLRMMM
jgi:hypothetical protein